MYPRVDTDHRCGVGDAGRRVRGRRQSLAPLRLPRWYPPYCTHIYTLNGAMKSSHIYCCHGVKLLQVSHLMLDVRRVGNGSNGSNGLVSMVTRNRCHSSAMSLVMVRGLWWARIYLVLARSESGHVFGVDGSGTMVPQGMMVQDRIGILLPNNQRQNLTLHILKDVLPYTFC